MNDSYKTISDLSEGTYKEKGSKFLAFAFPIASEDEFKEQLTELKKKYHDARHHCYAFKLGLTENEYRYSDDGEPNNSAGAPIYGQIQSFGITNVAIVVVRYFGGTKLGVGGLVTAYKEAAKDALSSAPIIEKTIDNYYRIEFGYEIMGEVMNFVKQHQLEIINQKLDEKGQITFKMRKSEALLIEEQLKAIPDLKLMLTKTI